VIKARRKGWAGYVARMGARKDVYRVLAKRPEGKRSFGRTRRRRQDNIQIDLQEVGWGGME